MAEKREIIIEVEVNNDKAQKRTEALKKRLEEQKKAVNETKKAISLLDKESLTYANDLAKLTSEQISQENALKRTGKEFAIHNRIMQANGNSVELLQAQNVRYSDALKRVDQSTERGRKLFNDLTNAIAANNEKIKEATRAAKGEVSAYDALQAKLTKLKKEYKDLAANHANGTILTKSQISQMRLLEAQINETDTALKEIDGTMGQFQRNVGNYKNAINEAIAENQGLMGSFEGAGGGAQDMMGQMQSLGKAIMSLAANPIGAVIAILAALVAAFSQTAGGSTMFKDIMGGLGQVFNKITGDLGKVVQKIIDFGVLLAKDPSKALTAFGNAIKENILNRFEAIIKIFPSIGNIIKETLTGNFDAAGEEAKKAGDLFLQMQTGVVGLTVKAKDYANELKKSAEAGVKFTQMQRAIDEQNRALLVSQTKLTGVLQISRNTLNDDTLGWKERNKAAAESFINAEKLAAVEIKLAKNTLESINLKIQARKMEGLTESEFSDEKAQALAGVIASENNYVQTLRDLGEEKRKLSLDELESRLDVLVDVADKSKMIAEQQIADGRVDFNAREKLLSDLVSAEKISTTEKIALLNGFDAAQKQSVEEREALLIKSKEDYQSSTNEFVRLISVQQGKQIDLNKMLETSSTEERLRIMKEIDLAERAQNRLREIVQERSQAEQDFVATSNTLLDEKIANQKTKIEKGIADEQALFAIKAENEIIGNAEKSAQIDAQMKSELVKFANNEAMKFEIKKKYELQNTILKKQQQTAELAATEQMLGEASALFAQNTIAYKVLATSQAVINTYLAATAALASGSKINPIFGIVSAGVAVATGLMSVAKINGVKFEDGGELKGKSHAQGGIPFSIGGQLGFEAEGGEFMVNKKSTMNSSNAISTINSNPNTRFEAIPFAAGGSLSTSPMLAQNEATQIQNESNKRIPIVVTVEDIRRAFARVDVQDRKRTF